MTGVADYYTLGRSGLRVSRLAFGAMTFGTEWGWGADKDTARQMTNAYLDAGGNFFDTADLYTGGTSEKWLGEFIAERKARDKAVIATKFSFNAGGGPNTGGNSRKNMMRAVEGSLKRLGTDYVDLYILHVWDQVTPVEEVMRAFEELVRAGKIRHAGLSNTPAWYTARGQTIAELRGTEPICALQMEYNLRERSIEHEFTALGAELGMGFMVWGPLGAGLLSGKYRPSCQDGATGEGRLEVMKANPASGRGMVSERDWTIIAEVENVAKELGRSMAQVAINWVTNRPTVGSVILGATKLAQLEDNLGALSFNIPTELREKLDAVSAPPPLYPYTFFTSTTQSRAHGGAAVGDKPVGYYPRVVVPAIKKA